MSHTPKFRLVGILFATIVGLMTDRGVLAWGPEPELIPREVFFGNPDRASVQISPDGMRLSYLAANQGVMNVWVQTIGNNDAVALTKSSQRPIRIYFWAENSQQIIYGQDRGGDENFHFYAVDIATGNEIDLTPFDGVQARVTGIDRDKPDEILVALNNRDPKFHDVWRINTRTGKGQMVFQNNDGYSDLTADSNFQVRLASKVNERTGGLDVYTRDSGDGQWYELVRWGLEDSAVSEPMGMSRDGKTIYLADSRGTNTSRLFAYSIDGSNGPTYQMLAADERADVSGVVQDPKTNRPQAVAFEYARREWKILDPSIKSDWEKLKHTAEGDMNISSRDNADAKWIVSYVRDNGPVSYYLYDRKAGSATFLFTNRTQLEGLKLATMKPVVVTARDGLKLVCYLTVPPDQNQRKLPMVLLVHGGPWGRDSWGFNSLHQWLANRGYAVMSVNFRGSTGMGKEFMNAGNGEWAGKMHDDLIDAVNWTVAEGIADPAKVAIMGGSYGGYATLVGLTFTPDYFAAGVDIVGPSHIATLLKTIPPYWEPIRAMFETRVGKLSDTAYMDSISPLTKVNAIRKPLLIGQGKNDPRVNEAESRQIVDAMQAKNLPVTYVVFPDEGHGFARPQNNMAFFAITEAFLAKHIGGRFEPIRSEVRQSSADIQAGAELVPGLSESSVTGEQKN